MHHKRRRLILNISHFFAYENGDLARRLLQTPGEHMQALYDAVTELTRGLDPKYLKEGEQVLVGFEGPFVSRRVTPRDLLSCFISSLVYVEGIVTKYCCDGSDEYDGKVNCLNTCWEAGKVARDKLKKKISTFQEGATLRKQEIEKAKVAIVLFTGRTS